MKPKPKKAAAPQPKAKAAPPARPKAKTRPKPKAKVVAPPAAARRPDGKWTKGTCGNPSGRPKKGHSIAEQLRAALHGAPRGRIIRKLISQSESGILEATKLVLAYAIGPPPREPLVNIDLRREAEPRADLHRLTVAQLEELAHLTSIAEGIIPPEPPAAPCPPRDFEQELAERLTDPEYLPPAKQIAPPAAAEDKAEATEAAPTEPSWPPPKVISIKAKATEREDLTSGLWRPNPINRMRNDR